MNKMPAATAAPSPDGPAKSSERTGMSPSQKTGGASPAPLAPCDACLSKTPPSNASLPGIGWGPRERSRAGGRGGAAAHPRGNDSARAFGCVEGGGAGSKCHGSFQPLKSRSTGSRLLDQVVSLWLDGGSDGCFQNNRWRRNRHGRGGYLAVEMRLSR